MTYSLFELAKEKAGDWIVDDPEDGEDSTVSVCLVCLYAE